MRASHLFIYLFIYVFSPEVTLHSLLTAGAANVRQNVCSVVSHSRGYSGPAWVEFRWCISRLKHKTCASNDLRRALASPPFLVWAGRWWWWWGGGCRLNCGASIYFCCFLMYSQRNESDFPCLSSSIRPRRRSDGHPRSRTATPVHLRRPCCAFAAHIK